MHNNRYAPKLGLGVLIILILNANTLAEHPEHRNEYSLIFMFTTLSDLEIEGAGIYWSHPFIKSTSIRYGVQFGIAMNEYAQESENISPFEVQNPSYTSYRSERKSEDYNIELFTSFLYPLLERNQLDIQCGIGPYVGYENNGYENLYVNYMHEPGFEQIEIGNSKTINNTKAWKMGLNALLGASWKFSDVVQLQCEYQLIGYYYDSKFNSDSLSDGFQNNRTVITDKKWHLDTGYVRMGLVFFY